MRSPGALAIRSGTPSGWTDTTWAELYEDTQSVSMHAPRLRGHGPVVVIVDNTAASAATILGLATAGVDVLLVEENSSYLADPGSVVHHIGAATVVGPAVALRDLPAAMDRLPYEECRARAKTRPPAGSPEGEILQLTSGSTGEPRAARHPLRNIRYGGYTYQRVFGLASTDEIFAAVPLAHSFGLVGGLAASVVSGARLWTLPRFGIRSVLSGLREGATTLLGTPLVYQLLASALRAERGFPGLRTALSSGGPLPQHLAAEVSTGLSARVRQVYGSTEAGLIAYQPDSGEPWPPGSVGVAAPDVQLRIEPCPPGISSDDGSIGLTHGAVTGQLVVRSPTLFAGYLGAQDPRNRADGSYATGDLARIDDRGRLYLAGRKETFVNVGGRKVSPRRIERILSGFHGLRDVFVYAAMAPDQEQRLHAAVVLEPTVRAEDVIDFCRSRHLAPYEVPHHVHVLDGLPYTGMGKVDRRRVIAATTGPDTGIAQDAGVD